MSRNQRDNTNDIVGGQDSLGPVHLPSAQEQRDAALVLAAMTTRWGLKYRRNNARRSFVLEELLLMLDLKEEPSKRYQRGAKMRELGFKHRYKAKE